MTISQRLIAGIASILVMALIVDLVRRRKLREEYALLWLASGRGPGAEDWVASQLKSRFARLAGGNTSGT